jgi:transcriptional regulator with XRE-family HTH domain
MAMTKDDDEAERRRERLRQFLRKHNVTRAELAKRARLPTANTLYNFLGGRTNTLNLATAEKLVSAVPGASLQDLLGHDIDQGVTAQVPLLAVRSTAARGSWRPTYEVGGFTKPIELAMQPGIPADEAVRILDDHCDLIYQRGAYICIQSLASLDRPLREGDMVLLDVINDRRQHEVTVRRVSANAKGELHLTFMANAADPRDPGVALPKPYDGQILAVRPGERGRVSMMVMVHEP